MLFYSLFAMNKYHGISIKPVQLLHICLYLSGCGIRTTGAPNTFVPPEQVLCFCLKVESSIDFPRILVKWTHFSRTCSQSVSRYPRYSFCMLARKCPVDILTYCLSETHTMKELHLYIDSKGLECS